MTECHWAAIEQTINDVYTEYDKEENRVCGPEFYEGAFHALARIRHEANRLKILLGAQSAMPTGRITIKPYHGAWQAMHERGPLDNPEVVPPLTPVYAPFPGGLGSPGVEMPVQAPTFEECQDILIAHLNGATNPFSFARCRQVPRDAGHPDYKSHNSAS